MNIKTNLKSFIKSFRYAFVGIISGIKSERNIRFHLCAAFYVIFFMQFYDMSTTRKAVVFLVIGAMISLEMINTSIESIVDLCSPDYHPLAKKAKDISAGAVFCMAITAVVIAVAFFWDIDTFVEICEFFSHNIIAMTALVISAILWFLFIFKIDIDNKAVGK